MSNPAHPAERRQTFTVITAPPVRSALQAAVYTMIGAVLLVVAQSLGWSGVVTAVAVAIMVLGLVLSGLTLVALRRLRSEMIMEPMGLTVVRGGRRRQIGWAEISDVTMSGTRLVFKGREGFRDEVVLFDRRRTSARTLSDVVAAVQVYLDASRGYRS